MLQRLFFKGKQLIEENKYLESIDQFDAGLECLNITELQQKELQKWKDKTYQDYINALTKAKEDVDEALHREEQKARESQSRYLSSESIKALDRKEYSLAFNLAKTAYQKMPTSLSKEALARFHGIPLIGEFGQKNLIQAKWHPNGKYILTTSYGNQIRCHNLNGEIIFEKELLGNPYGRYLKRK